MQQAKQRAPGAIQRWLPRGDSLDAVAFAERHRTLSILLGLHIPALIVFGIVQDMGVIHSILEVALAGALLGLAQFDRVPRRFKGILISAGLVWCSAVLVHFSGGMIEAHFHFFIILAFIALYQDWAAFGWTILFTALSHGAASAFTPELMFNHEAAVQRPWTWALVHAGAVLFAATGQIIGWRHAEDNQNRVSDLNTQLLREQSERQASYSRIYVNLARRNQSLLHRQLAVIDELEQHEENPDTLRRLFALDHLTTRVRRNAESLLVMAGEESPRRWSSAVSLADIARAAASEIEQYERTDVRVTDDMAVTGSAVVDITHLLAELIENAAEYSAPETTVLIAGQVNEEGATITIEDYGIGMSEKDLLKANQVLADPPELDEEQVRQLGFQVVGRLAGKLGLRVRLRPTVGGSGPRAGAGRRGTTAVVEIPLAVLSDAPLPVPQAPAAEEPVAAPTEPQQPAPITDTVEPLDDELAEVTQLGADTEIEPTPTVQPQTAPAPTVPAPQVATPVPPAPEPTPAVPDPVQRTPEPEYSPPPAVTIPARPRFPEPSPQPTAPTAPAAASPPPSTPAASPPPVPAGTEPGGSPMLFLAKQPPAAPSGLSRKGRRARRNQQQPEPAPQPVQHHQPAPVQATPPVTTATPSVTSNQPTNGGSSIDDIDQLAQYASRLPQRTPNASLAPGLRQQPPSEEPEPIPGSAPEARQALSAFQSAARSARRSTDESMEHPS